MNRQTGGPVEEAFARVAELAPAFGGLFLDQDQVPVVVLADSTQVAAAVAAVRTVFADHPRIAGAEIRVRPGRYSLGQLWEWRERSVPVLNIPGVTRHGVAYAENRVNVGVTRPEVVARVERELTRLGVPREAVLIESSPLAQPLQAGRATSQEIPPQQAARHVSYDSLAVWLEVPPEVPLGVPVSLRLIARNATERPLQLTLGGLHPPLEPNTGRWFSSRYDLIVTRPDGTEVWSRLHWITVPAVAEEKELPPGDTLEYADVWDQKKNSVRDPPDPADPLREPVSPGLYYVRGRLHVLGPDLKTEAVPLRIVP